MPEPGMALDSSCGSGGAETSNRRSLMERLREISLDAYDRLIGLELSEVAVGCCITKAPCGGQKAGRNPVGPGKRGIKPSVAVGAKGNPPGGTTAPAHPPHPPPFVPPPKA